MKRILAHASKIHAKIPLLSPHRTTRYQGLRCRRSEHVKCSCVIGNHRILTSKPISSLFSVARWSPTNNRREAASRSTLDLSTPSPNPSLPSPIRLPPIHTQPIHRILEHSTQPRPQSSTRSISLFFLSFRIHILHDSIHIYIFADRSRSMFFFSV